jgi:hypothetical protein
LGRKWRKLGSGDRVRDWRGSVRQRRLNDDVALVFEKSPKFKTVARSLLVLVPWVGMAGSALSGHPHAQQLDHLHPCILLSPAHSEFPSAPGSSDVLALTRGSYEKRLAEGTFVAVKLPCGGEGEGKSKWTGAGSELLKITDHPGSDGEWVLKGLAAGEYAQNAYQEFLASPVLLAAAAESSRSTKKFDDLEKSIKQSLWQKEIDALTQNGLSNLLKEMQVQAPRGAVVRIRVVDNSGWIIGLTHPTRHTYFPDDVRVSASGFPIRISSQGTMDVSLAILREGSIIGAITFTVDGSKLVAAGR